MPRENNRTFLIFIALLLVTWPVELLVGVYWTKWWWTTDWYAWGRPGVPSLVQEISELAVWPEIRGGMAETVSLGWTPERILQVVLGLFLSLYLVNGLYNGFLRPFLRRWQLGVRKPTLEEEQRFRKVHDMVARHAGSAMSYPYWMVAEGPGLALRWIGYVLVIDREILAHRYLPPLLLHELAHANSEDRLARRLYALLPPVQLVWGIFGGWGFAIGHFLLYPCWMWYFRHRIFAADAFVVQLGYGHGLLRALEEIYLPVDPSTKGARILRPQPYIAQRLDRIRQLVQTQQGTLRSPGAIF